MEAFGVVAAWIVAISGVAGLLFALCGVRGGDEDAKWASGGWAVGAVAALAIRGLFSHYGVWVF